MIFYILLLGFIFRVISLNQSLWLDEATTALAAKMDISYFFTNFMPAYFHPPLYYQVIHYWSMLFGTSEVALRVLSVIFGVLTIYAVYLIAKELKFKHPFYPMLLMATSGLHVYYSQEARMYAMAAWLVSYLVLSYLRKKWVLFSILLSFIYLTDYLSILILPALVIYTYIFDRKIFKKLLYSTSFLLITFIGWLPIFFSQLTNGLAVKENASGWWNILGPVTFKNILLIPTKFIVGRISLDNKILYGLVIGVLLIIFGYAISKAKNKLIWSWFGISFLFGVAVSFFIPTLTYFRYLFILPALYLLLSENINKSLFIVILFFNILFTSIYLFYPGFHRENWREVSNIIGSEKIVFPVSSQKEALIYYGKEENIISGQELRTIGNEPVWLSRYVWEVFDPTDSTRLQLIDMRYNMILETNYNGVVIQKYESRN